MEVLSENNFKEINNLKTNNSYEKNNKIRIYNNFSKINGNKWLIKTI